MRWYYLSIVTQFSNHSFKIYFKIKVVLEEEKYLFVHNGVSENTKK